MHIGAGAQGKTCVAQGENVTLRFIEDENETIINGFRATAMHRFAHAHMVVDLSLTIRLIRCGKITKKQEHSKCASVDPSPNAKRPRVSAEDPVTPSVHPPLH